MAAVAGVAPTCRFSGRYTITVEVFDVTVKERYVTTIVFWRAGAARCCPWQTG
jgi:hypothetical protein